MYVQSHAFHPGGFVNDILDSRSSRFKSKFKLILLGTNSIKDSLNLGTFCKSCINVSFSKGNLVFIFLLELSKLGALKVGLNGQPDGPPRPGLTNVVVPDGSLAAVEGQLLILELLELHTGRFSSCS